MILLMLSLAGCGSRSDAPAAEEASPSDIQVDLRLVAIEARLNRHYNAGATILVRTPTSTHGYLDFQDMGREEFIVQLCQPEQGSGLLDRSTAEDFIRVNQTPTALSDHDFGNVDWITTIPEDAFEGYWSGDRASAEGWEKLREDFPQAIGAAEISAIGWNQDRSEGVIYIGALSPPGIGQGGFFAFRRHGSQYACQELMMAPSWITKVNKEWADNRSLASQFRADRSPTAAVPPL